LRLRRCIFLETPCPRESAGPGRTCAPRPQCAAHSPTRDSLEFGRPASCCPQRCAVP